MSRSWKSDVIAQESIPGAVSGAAGVVVELTYTPTGTCVRGEATYLRQASEIAWERLWVELVKRDHLQPSKARKVHLEALVTLSKRQGAHEEIRCFSAGEFARAAWPDSPGWTRISNCGPYGATRGINMGRSAGAVLTRYVNGRVLRHCHVHDLCQGFRFTGPGLGFIRTVATRGA